MALRLPPPSRPSVRLSVRLCPLASEVNYSVSSTFEWAGRGRARERGSEASLTLELSYDPIIRLRSDGRTEEERTFFVYLFDDALRLDRRWGNK